MNFSELQLDAEQEQFAKEARAFLDEVVTEEVHEEERRTGNGFNLKVHLALGEKGWLTPTWPVDEGGAALDAVRARIRELEMARARIPSITAGTTRLVYSAVEKYLDREILADLKPKVAAGEVRFCLGYTDPNGGSDIANSTLRAVRDGDEWVLNGSKIFTTGAQNCQYTFLITRTDPELPKHKGLTMFLVPLDTPGVEIQALRTFAVERTNIVYYSDVRISDKYRLGGVNDGWSVLHGPLDEEHSIGGEADKFADLSGGTQFVTERARAPHVAVAWATTPREDGSRPADDPLVRYRLGQIEMDIQAALCTP